MTPWPAGARSCTEQGRRAMFEDHRSGAAGADTPTDDWGAYRVTHPRERLQLLNQVRDSGANVALHAPGGSALNTTLWAVDAALGRVSFSADADHPQLQAMLQTSEAMAVCYLDSIKLQFDLHDLVLVRSAQACSLQGLLPSELFRFQRRNAFRVRAPERFGPTASFRHPSMPDMQLELRVLDISATGCSMWLPQDVPPLQPGTRLARVEVVLDAQTEFQAIVTLQHVASLATPGSGVRLGCEWQPRSDHATRALQRWVDQAQKRRRAQPAS